MTENIQILLVEDDPFHRSVLAEGLEAYYNYAVAQARNLEEAARILETQKTELIVLDCVLDDHRFAAIDWAENLRLQTAWESVPILFVTAHIRDMEDRVQRISFSDLLGKPFTFDDITKKMRALLADRRIRPS